MVSGRGGGPVHGGRAEGTEVGEPRQEHPLELLGAGTDLVVQAGVLDGDAGRAGQGEDHGLVLVVERFAVAAVAQVEVAVDAPADADGDAEERLHRRMACGEARGARVVEEAVDPQGHGVFDEVAEEALAVRQVHPRQGPAFPVFEPQGEELVQSGVVVVQHAQGAVAGVHQLHRGRDDAAEHDRQVQFAADGQHRVQQCPHPLLRAVEPAHPFGDVFRILVRSRRGRPGSLPTLPFVLAHATSYRAGTPVWGDRGDPAARPP